MHISTAISLIEWFVGLNMIIFGINQMMRPIQWLKYMPVWIHKMSPFSPETEMRLHSLGNIILGLFLIDSFGYAVVAAWIAFVWWLSILPFAWRVDWTIGLRDTTIIACLLALIMLLS